MAMFSLYELEPSLPPVRVLDIGALDDSNFPPRYAPLVPTGRVHIVGFEPHPPGCNALNRKYGPPHCFLPLFVGAGGKAKFHRTNWPDTSSLYRPNARVMEMFTGLAECTRLEEIIDVDTVRLDDVPEAAPVDFFKIDVQGAELDVFAGASKALDTALVIQTEVSFVELYEGAPLFGEVDTWLRRRGFWFHTLTDLLSLSFQPLRTGDPDQGLNQRLSADAIYTRDPSKPDGLSVEQLRMTAVLMHDLFRSFDMAYRWLAAADARDGGDLGARYLGRLTQL